MKTKQKRNKNDTKTKRYTNKWTDERTHRWWDERAKEQLSLQHSIQISSELRGTQKASWFQSNSNALVSYLDGNVQGQRSKITDNVAKKHPQTFYL